MSEDFNYLDERFADIQMLRYQLNGFDNFSSRKKEFIYYLSQATLCGRDITFDQFGRFNLLIRRTFEVIYEAYEGSWFDPDYLAFEVYLKRLWFSNGIYHHYGCNKFVPAFSPEFLLKEIKHVEQSLLSLRNGINAEEFCKIIFPVIFDPEILSKRVNLNSGEDLVLTSACNFYAGVTQKEVENYYSEWNKSSEEHQSYGLNSTLVKNNCIIEENVWKVDGLYGSAISKIIYWLNKAIDVAENEQQKKVIRLLIDFYRTGDLQTFDHYSIEWLKEQEGQVDFINGFIEVYGDPLGIKGTWEGIVNYKDSEATKRTQMISSNAEWFEAHSPIDPRFRKSEVKGISANVVCVAMLGGDEYPSSAIGINLPNSEWIRAKHGSKSITIGNLTEAYHKAAMDSGFQKEFAIDEDTLSLIESYGNLCDDLHTDLHECLGHGSGKLLDGVASDALRSYSSTIEEARADLFGLYYIADPKILELGLLPNDTAYRAQYYTYLQNGLLTQLVRIEPGHQIEESHMRNRALISRWALEINPQIAELVVKNGKTYLQVNDYNGLRDVFAYELAEIQRIKSEGDYESAQLLVERYAVQVNPMLHEEMIQRYTALNIAPYKGFINPRMIPICDTEGNIIDIKLDYTESYTSQMLRYGKEYSFL